MGNVIIRGITDIIIIQLATYRRAEVHSIYDTPLLELVFRAATVHRMHNDPRMVTFPPPFSMQYSQITTLRGTYLLPLLQATSHALVPAAMLMLLAAQVQRCTLLSIKTGGCPETCTYCSQSSSWKKETGLKAEKLMDLEEVYEVCAATLSCSWHSSM